MKLLFQLISFLLPLCTIGQSTDTNALFSGFDDRPRGNQGVRIAFYNCENLFDIEHDSLKDDKSFTADGLYHWDMRKYWEKQKNISKEKTLKIAGKALDITESTYSTFLNNTVVQVKRNILGA